MDYMELEEAALAYARPIVAEECAKIVEERKTQALSGGRLYELASLADAIREHGKVE